MCSNPLRQLVWCDSDTVIVGGGGGGVIVVIAVIGVVCMVKMVELLNHCDALFFVEKKLVGVVYGWCGLKLTSDILD